MKTARFLIALSALLFVGCGQPSTDPVETAAEHEPELIRVVTSGGFTAAFDILGPIFEKATGISIITEYGSSMGGAPDSIPTRLARGETMDVLIFNGAAFDDIAAGGYLRADTRVDLARSQVGMAVRAGAPIPDISTQQAFIDTLLAASSIGYSASVSGTYLSSELFPRLGIWDEIESKTQRVVGERVASVVARGEVEIGFQAVSEIISIDGIAYVGPIPSELQQVSSFAAVIGADADNPAGAARLIEFLSSKAAAAVIEPTGLAAIEHDEAQGAPASNGQVRAITSGGFTAAFNVLGPLYEQATGIEVITSYGSSMGGGPESIPVRLARGETFDILIMNRPPLDGFAEEGRILPASRVNLARSAIGLAVRSGAPKPDISTREALIETLLAAESVGFSASVSGTYLSTVMFPSLGVWDEIESKTVRVVTERVAEVVARGEVEIGFQAVSAILPIEGADFAGRIPAELDQETWFSAGIMQNAENSVEAQRLIEFLNSSAAAPVIDRTGLVPNPQ